jgi:hypothetical protein
LTDHSAVDAPVLRRYFDRLERIADEAGDAKLDALAPFMRSHAPAVADDLGWTALLYEHESQEPVRFSVRIGSLDASEPDVSAPARMPLRSNLYDVVSAALCGSIAKGALNTLHTPVGETKTSSFRLDLANGEDARIAVAKLIARVNRASFALTLSNAFELVDAFRSPLLYNRLMLAAGDAIERTCSGEGSISSPPDHDAAIKDIANEIFKEVPRLREKLGSAPRLEPEALRADSTGSMLWLDAVFADLLESFGNRGAEQAKRVRQKSREAWAAQKELSWLWVDLQSPTGTKWVDLLADSLWLDRVHAQTERRGAARPFSISSVRVEGGSYVKMPKTMASLSWAFGAPGTRAVEIDGDSYALEPSAATDALLLPRTYPLFSMLEGHERRPHQTVLPLEAEETALPVAIVNAAQYAITPLASKVALLVLAADDVKRGHMQSLSLSDLVRRLHPTAKRFQARELAAAENALRELRRIVAILPDGRDVALFDTAAFDPSLVAGTGPSANVMVTWGLTRTFLDILARGVTGGRLKGNEFNGDFLINIDGAMRIPNKRPGMLRVYVRLAAHWNAYSIPGSGGAFDASRMPAYTIDRLATMANSYSAGVVEYLQANDRKALKASKRVQLSKERKSIRDDIEALEEMNLLRVEKAHRDEIRLLPPGAHHAAWEQMRKGGSRPDSSSGRG